MMIEHQKIVDADGNPTAAVVPWEEFEAIRERLEGEEISPEWKAEIHRRMDSYRAGTAEVIPGDQVFDEVREMCRNLPSSKKTA